MEGGKKVFKTTVCTCSVFKTTIYKKKHSPVIAN